MDINNLFVSLLKDKSQTYVTRNTRTFYDISQQFSSVFIVHCERCQSRRTQSASSGIIRHMVFLRVLRCLMMNVTVLSQNSLFIFEKWKFILEIYLKSYNNSLGEYEEGVSTLPMHLG